MIIRTTGSECDLHPKISPELLNLSQKNVHMLKNSSPALQCIQWHYTHS